MPAYKRTDWNDIIQQVNDVLQNPPPDTDCEPLPTLDEVGPNHRWSKADIQEVQDALKATCEDISFDTIPELWKQSIIDEINEAIEQAWCDCEPDDEPDCEQADIDAENGLEFALFNNGPPKVVSNCLGTDTPPIPLAPLIHGLTFGQPDIFNRVWRVVRRNHQNNGVVTQSSPLASGILSCQGVVTYTGSVELTTAAGINVTCSDCFSTGCEFALAEAALAVGTQPTVFYNTYHLIIDTAAAFCRASGDDCP